MGKPTGFIELKRSKQPARPVAERLQDWREVYKLHPPQVLADQGARCMDCGIPFCHQGCPLGNLIPDWNDLVYRDRWQAAVTRLLRDQQLPGVHRPAVPGAVRRRVRARHQRRPGDDQVDRVGDHRARDGGGLGQAGAAGVAHRQDGRGGRLGPVRPGRRRSAEQGRPHRHRVRARRSHRRAAALRHPRVQDGEGDPRSPAPPDGSRGHRLQAGLRRRRVAGRGDAEEVLRRGGPRLRRPGRPRPADSRARARGHPLRDGLPAAAEQALRRATPSRRASSSRRRTSTS